jgi:hypothetical protein
MNEKLEVSICFPVHPDSRHSRAGCGTSEIVP